MIKRLYVNKCGRLILGEGQKKIIKKQKGKGLGVLFLPLGKKRKYGKKKQNNYRKMRCFKKSYSTKQ